MNKITRLLHHPEELIKTEKDTVADMAYTLSTIVCVIVLMSRHCHGTPLHKQITRSTTVSNNLKRQLSTMRGAIDEALSEFILSEMDCTSVEVCRTYLTSLRLTTLPQVTDIRQNNNWDSVMQQNMNGLQDFNYYLQSVFGSPQFDASNEIVPSQTGFFNSVTEQLRDVSNMLFQFMNGFETYMETTYCRSLNVRPLSNYPPCEICNQPTLPSANIEIVRNYHFLMQFYDYLGDFLNLYNKFLFSATVPSQC